MSDDIETVTKEQVETRRVRQTLWDVRQRLVDARESIPRNRAILVEIAGSMSFYEWQAAYCRDRIRSFGRDPDAPEDPTMSPTCRTLARVRDGALASLKGTAVRDEHQGFLDTAVAMIPELEVLEAMYAGRMRELGEDPDKVVPRK